MARHAESRGATSPFSIANLTSVDSQFRSDGPFAPVGPVRPVDLGGPGGGLAPIGPGAFRPAGDLNERPSPAGVYDALLGGTAHRRVDRRSALAILLAWPDAPAAARAMKDFLVRAVRFAARNGVNQFLALGGGAGTVDPVHEVACAVAPESQTVYVEPDPLVIARSLPDIRDRQVALVQADVSRPAEVLRHPGVLAHLDVTQPIAVVMVPGLPEIADHEEPREVLRGYREATARGSLLLFSQLCDEGSARGLRALFERAGQPGAPRPHEQTVELVSTWEPIEPGLVPAEEWNAPDERVHPHFGRLPVYASVGWH
ncbi:MULTISPECIES: SAM-dependent methyltransferase [unclassified Frankia]|uniref:SAM-dependent methyltransferase n=1 Tax=unclassified Frankia TaxID=2632575 RepID=UPI0027DCF8DA|nr:MULTISPECIES: SAM-dependent methyltransferase [unclassified Frankia]